MTKDAIIAEIKKLTPEEIAVVDARWQEMVEHPERSMTVDELKRKVSALTKQHELRA
jgi:hypothetical protein